MALCLRSTSFALTVSNKAKLESYLQETVAGLELLRDESGLMKDKLRVLHDYECSKPPCVVIVNPNISLTNVALDLILQKSLNKKIIVLKILQTLSALEYHHDSGLFFSWYKSGKKHAPATLNISSVDNYHLALALWTLGQDQAESEIASLANSLFNRMDFSMFYDAKKGLIHGNFIYANGTWTVENYYFDNLGSEVRGLYGAAWALGLFKKFKRLDFFRLNLFSTVEVFESDKGVILKTWDGGAFQLMLPELLLSESRYSDRLKESFNNFSQFILDEQKRRGLDLPAGHSACNMGVEGTKMFGDMPKYRGALGSIDLVSKHHDEVKNSVYREWWDMVITPHAVILAIPFLPDTLTEAMAPAEQLGNQFNFFEKGIGWLDALYVRGEYKGEAVPISISLDQLMIALSLSKTLAPDGMSLSARAINQNTKVRLQMKPFYNWINWRMGN